MADKRPPTQQEPFDRFDAAMGVILSVSKADAVAEEKRQKERRKAGRDARKGHRPA